MSSAREKALEILKYSESLHDGDLSIIGLQPKLDPSDIWTEGWGHAIINPKTGKFLRGIENESYARELCFINNPEINDDIEAETLLSNDFKIAEDQLKELGLDLNDNQFYACVDFIFNVGIGNFRESTLYKYIKKDPLDPRISQAFVMWIKSGGRSLRGLAIRRLKEANLYFSI